MDAENTDVRLLRKKIGDLGYELEKLGSEKEILHRKKKDIDEKLSEFISSAKDLKAKKTAIDDDIKKKKLLRTTLNKDLKEYSRKISEFQKAKRICEPADVKKQIEAMQYAIETAGLTFEKEKSYMERIRQLKAKLAEFERAEVQSGAKDAAANMTSKKVEADALHNEIQKFADESTKLFASLTEKAKEIILLKQKRAEILNTLKGFKGSIDDANSQLSGALNTWLEVSKTPVAVAMPDIKADAEDLFAKFKAAKKLNKEDILKLQRFAARGGGSINPERKF